MCDFPSNPPAGAGKEKAGKSGFFFAPYPSFISYLQTGYGMDMGFPIFGHISIVYYVQQEERWRDAYKT